MDLHYSSVGGYFVDTIRYRFPYGENTWITFRIFVYILCGKYTDGIIMIHVFSSYIYHPKYEYKIVPLIHRKIYVGIHLYIFRK